MAKQEGKGWFAIMLGKHISFNTKIPTYILDAILFAKETYSSNIVADIIEYRMNKHFENDNKLDFANCKAELLKYRNGTSKLEDVACNLDLVLPKDQILTLIAKLK